MKTLALAVLEGIWQASRYALAAGMTALAVAAVPFLVATILTVVGGICVGALSLMMLGSAVTGAADPPIIALLVAVALPIGFIIAVIAVFAAVVAGVLLFIGVLVLPVSLLTETVLQSDRVCSIPLRLASYLLSGGLVGAAVGVVWFVFNPQADLLAMMTVGTILFLMTALSVSFFGFILTTAEVTRRVVGKIASRLREQILSKDEAGSLVLQGEEPSQQSLVAG